MQAELISTFQAYGGCVEQRYKGAEKAIAYGAVGFGSFYEFTFG